MKRNFSTGAPWLLSCGLAVLLLPCAALGQGGRTIRVTDSTEARQALAGLMPGDTVNFADGDYDTGLAVISVKGAADSPVVLQAENIGQARIIGRSGFRFQQASFLTLSGFNFATDQTAPVDIRGCHDVQLVRNRFKIVEPRSSTAFHWVFIHEDGAVNSINNRVTYCLFEEKSHVGNCVSLNGSGGQCAQYTQIDHNYFRNVGPRIANGEETIRAGVGAVAQSSSYTTIEFNLFESCDADPEIVSMKSCDSVVRYNTFVRCQGGVTLRNGSRNVVEGNFFFGENKAGARGVRLYGDDHVVFNNYHQDLADNALIIENGDSIHARPRRTVVVYNTYVGCDTPIVLGGRRNANLNPQDILLANNLVQGDKNTLVSLLSPVDRLVWLGNIMFPTGSATLGVNVSDQEIHIADPLLNFDGTLWRLTANSPAIQASLGDFPFVIMDMDGQMRKGSKDVGADEFSSDPITIQPLGPGDVGPDAP